MEQNIVNNVKIYDLKESILAAALPMRTEKCDYDKEEITERDLKRIKNLITAVENDNPAHGQFLSTIMVNFDLTFSNKAWVEMERYKFMTFCSSQSTMHKIASFDLNSQYVEYVDPRIIEVMNELKDRYNSTKDKEDYLRLLYSNPCGFRLTARLSASYRCLRNIYRQRKNHRLPEWIAFCKWIETLPYADELLIN